MSEHWLHIKVPKDVIETISEIKSSKLAYGLHLPVLTML